MDFLAVDDYMSRRSDAQLDLVTFDAEDGYSNVRTDAECFVGTAGQNQHGGDSLWGYSVKRWRDG